MILYAWPNYPWVLKHFLTGKHIQVEAWRKGGIYNGHVF